jgi:plasmid stability protein
MVDIVLDLDDRLIERLRAKASLNGRSLEGEIRAIIHSTDPLTPEERLSLSDQIRAKQAKASDLLSEKQTREARDRR